MVMEAMVALDLFSSFFSVLANSGMYPVSGIIREPIKVKYNVPTTQTPIPKGVILKKAKRCQPQFSP